MRNAASRSRLLLAAACHWESTVPLAVSLRDAGFDVSILAPRNHPLHAVPGLMEYRLYRPLAPMRSLRRAIAAVSPAVIMPCDEPTMFLLQELRQERNLSPAVRDAVERALGPEESAALLNSRAGLAKIAEQAAVRVPRSAEIRSARQLVAWLKQYGAPAYLKIDRSTGGRGVVRVESTLAGLAAYFRLRLLFGVPRTFWLWLRWGDLTSLPLLRAETPAAITIQQAIDGLPANCAFTAWQGRLLACVAVEALETRSQTGVATVIRLRSDQLMEDMARKVVAHLHLSGLHGLDFILARDTGEPWLIEINNRPTQTAYLRLGPGADLSGALYAAATGSDPEPVGAFKAQQIITLFDQPGEERKRADDLVALPETPPLPAMPLDLEPAARSVVASP